MFKAQYPCSAGDVPNQATCANRAQARLVREALRLMATVQLVEPAAAAREGLVAVGEEPARVPFWALTAFPATRALSLDQVRPQLGAMVERVGTRYVMCKPATAPCSGNQLLPTQRVASTPLHYMQIRYMSAMQCCT